MNNVYTQAAEEMKDIFKEVKKYLLHQQLVLMKKTQTQAQTQKVKNLILHKEENQNQMKKQNKKDKD